MYVEDIIDILKSTHSMNECRKKMNKLFEKDNELHYRISIKFEAIENSKTIDEYEYYAKLIKI